MKSKGNGTPQQCVANLLSLWQHEVPYARLKGMPTEIVDKTRDEAIVLAKSHTSWLIQNYEPRVTLNGVSADFNEEGKLQIVPDMVVNEV